MTPQEALKKYFGYNSFRPGQEEIISSILNGSNVLAILPTGAGKSICYQIPALMQDSFSIVISPLIALMKDQVDSLNQSNTVAAYINSSLDFASIEKVLSLAAARKIKLLYLSPEKVENTVFAERIKALAPAGIFIDEAHCISEWGHSFRPSYRKIRNFIELLGLKSVAAFTATATEDVREDIIAQLGMKDPQVFVRGFERPNLSIRVIKDPNKKERLLKILSTTELPGIIYAATRKQTEEACDFLRAHGIESVYYHAGLSAELRKLIQDDFLTGRINLIIATNAFGMGIDKSNIRTVIHFNMPQNIESYYQEIGRAGRDGLESDIFLLYDETDRAIQEFLINNSVPKREIIETVYDALCDYGKLALGNSLGNSIPLDKNLANFLNGEKITKPLLESSLKILDLSSYIKHDSEYSQKHFVQFLREPARLSKFVKEMTDYELKDLILTLMREYGGAAFKSRVTVSIASLSNKLETDPQSIANGLRKLHNAGIIYYEEPLKNPAVRIIGTRIKSSDLKLNYESLQRLVSHNLQKLEKMVGFVESRECRLGYILKYFGQELTGYRCGKCDICRGETADSSSITGFIAEHILTAVEENGRKIRKNKLIGILTGSARDAKSASISVYGSCQHFDKREIENGIRLLIKKKKLLQENDFLLLPEVEIEVGKDAGIDYEFELSIFNTLRQIRREAASKFGQPINLICPDEILREVARLKPVTQSQLFAINGFNERMFHKVGTEFINAVKELVANRQNEALFKDKNLPGETIKIFELLKKKYPLAEIAALTKLPEPMVAMQIESIIGLNPAIETDFLFDKNELAALYKNFENGIIEMKEVREKTGAKISYSKIRIALAKWRVNSKN